MHTADFDFFLPEDLIAQVPAEPRNHSRLLIVNRFTGSIAHRRFDDLPGYLLPGDLLVVNDTKVIPARLLASRIPTGGRVEFLLLEPVDDTSWEALMRSSRRPPLGTRFDIGTGRATAELLSDHEKGRCVIRIDSPVPVLDLLDELGLPPLPPYIRRKPTAPVSPLDRERYQTIFAAEPGAVAAPTAGLHFTDDTFETLAAQGIHHTALTLHVGIGTFRPVTVDQVEDHEMSSERFELPVSAAEAVAAARSRNGRVIAVGSTSVRTLETQATRDRHVQPGTGRTNIFIHPPYDFQVVDAMLTNFHLPRSTLLMMVCALGGRDLILRAYQEAVNQRYRFYSYGDCMLIV